jgi:hypothetical protein
MNLKMGIIKQLEEIAKENNVPLREVTKKFNDYSKEIYNKQYGVFLQQVSCWTVDLIRDDYKKDE